MTEVHDNPQVSVTLADPPGDVALGARRSEVLARLRQSVRPLGAADMAVLTGLHINTARFHLDGLVADGRAARTTEERDAPGRPKVLYSAQAGAAGPRSFALLAEILSGLVVALEGAGTPAVEAGRSWGRHLVDRPSAPGGVDVAEGSARLLGLLDAIGFQPQARPVGEGLEVRLWHCPFLDVARQHPEVVCSVHLGLMRGALSALEAPLEVTSLDPLVEPGVCVARLRPTATAPPARRPPATGRRRMSS